MKGDGRDKRERRERQDQDGKDKRDSMKGKDDMETPTNIYTAESVCRSRNTSAVKMITTGL